MIDFLFGILEGTIAFVLFLGSLYCFLSGVYSLGTVLFNVFLPNYPVPDGSPVAKYMKRPLVVRTTVALILFIFAWAALVCAGFVLGVR